MSKIHLAVNGTILIRLNDDVIYVDFDSQTVNLYNIDTDVYDQIQISSYNGAWYSYSVNAYSFSGEVAVNFVEREVTILSIGDLRHYEYEYAEQQYTVV